MKLAQHNGNKPQHNEISTAQRKQTATQHNVFRATETSLNTMKSTQHNGNKQQHNIIYLEQHNGNKPQHNEISTAQRKQAATQ